MLSGCCSCFQLNLMMRLISAHTFIFTKTPFLCRQIKAAYRLKTQNIHKFEFLSAWNHRFTVNNLSLCSYPVLNDRFLCVLVCVTVVVCDEVPDVFSRVVAANNFLVLGVQKLSSCHLFFLGYADCSALSRAVQHVDSNSTLFRDSNRP